MNSTNPTKKSGKVSSHNHASRLSMTTNSVWPRCDFPRGMHPNTGRVSVYFWPEIPNKWKLVYSIVVLTFIKHVSSVIIPPWKRNSSKKLLKIHACAECMSVLLITTIAQAYQFRIILIPQSAHSDENKLASPHISWIWSLFWISLYFIHKVRSFLHTYGTSSTPASIFSLGRT